MTPSGYNKADVTVDMLASLDLFGAVLDGSYAPPS